MKIGFTILLGATLALSACSHEKSAGTEMSNTNARASQSPVAAPSTKAESGGLRVGEASGSYTANGNTVELKYAYAAHAQRFGNESTVVLLTDQPIPEASLADEFKSQTLLLSGKLRGLEYAIDKDGYWVRYHPGQYQESKPRQLKELRIEGDVVRGTDEDSGDFTNGKYSRSVKFAAALVKS